jgi:hypothetical protein
MAGMKHTTAAFLAMATKQNQHSMHSTPPRDKANRARSHSRSEMKWFHNNRRMQIDDKRS